ncbi:PA2169 family four-helix-bundle protein [Taibaiella soli]|uniref:Aldehyde dehydrogenase n=1 Tax=Taibaiella soli TaxID=1649169 RepID=A0A2W2AM53_9BACT|nr:PA2169 family four-helix-bundle protein [Taibaiella soli]PZF74612.1 aldehyde dehydrogenase [Taibaiella soli]
MKTTNEANSEVLNDLLLINNDRIQGYQKAKDQLTDPKDSDLAMTFDEMAAQSRKNVTELQPYVHTDAAANNETTNAGKLYRTWMGVKATFAGDDRKSMLEACEYGEDKAQDAYRNALAEDGLSSEARELVTKQKQELKSSHDRIRNMRDQQRAA